MMPARWARAGVPSRAALARLAAGTLLVTVAGSLTGCANLAGPVPVAPVQAPQALAPVGDRPEPCRFLSQDEVARLAGDQRTQIVGSENACSFTIGGKFTYQINVMSNDNDRFDADRDRYFKNSVALPGVGEEAFYRDGTAITTVGARQGDSYFTVTLVPKVADPAGAGGAPAPAVPDGGARIDPVLAAADGDGDGVVDADQDGDARIDTGADPDAVAAADTDEDGIVDDGIADALAAGAGADAGGAGAAGARNTGAGANAGAGDGAGADGGGVDAVTDIVAAKARMADVAAAVANSL